MSVDVAEPPEARVTVLLLRDILGLEGEIDVERVTVPLNPFMLVRVIVDVVEEDCEMVREDGLAEMEKSGLTPTETVTVVECEMEPLEPFTVTV